jgi:hypothetical protein
MLSWHVNEEPRPHVCAVMKLALQLDVSKLDVPMCITSGVPSWKMLPSIKIRWVVLNHWLFWLANCKLDSVLPLVLQLMTSN